MMKRSVPRETPSAQGDETLTDSVYRRLKADIVWGRLEPDLPLRSDELRETYQIGISPLREALTRLAGDGLAIRLAQRGFKVASLDIDQVVDVARTRILVEGEALRASVELGDLQWETEIAAATHALSRILSEGTLRPESEAWAVPHRRFHMALIAGCESEQLLRIAANLFDHAERHRLLGERWRVGFEASGAISGRNRLLEHEKLAKATLDRDAESAVELLGRHHMLTARSVVHALEGDGASDLRFDLQRGRVSQQRRVVSQS